MVRFPLSRTKRGGVAVTGLPTRRSSAVMAPAPSGGDDTAVLTALFGSGKHVVLQSGIYNFTSLVLDNLRNMKVEGVGGEWYTNTATVLNCTGTGVAISCKGTGGSTDGNLFKNFAIVGNTATKLLDFDTTSTPTSAGSSNCKVEGVSFNSTSTSAILLSLSQSISCHVEDCAFSGGNVAIQGILAAGGFSNTQNIKDCYFHNQNTVPILNPGQNWMIEGCTFEPLLSGAAGAISSDGTGTTDGAMITGCSFQDATAGTWVTFNLAHGISMVGNLFSSGAVHVSLAAAVDGIAILGNRFEGATTVALQNFNLATAAIILGNSWNNGGNDYTGEPGTGSIVAVPGIIGFHLNGWTYTRIANLVVSTIGQGLRVAEGTNAKQGVATLVGGTVVVGCTTTTATSRILMTPQDNNTTGALRVSARTPGTSFTITSSNAGDTGVVAYQIFEPA